MIVEFAPRKAKWILERLRKDKRVTEHLVPFPELQIFIKAGATVNHANVNMEEHGILFHHITYEGVRIRAFSELDERIAV